MQKKYKLYKCPVNRSSDWLFGVLIFILGTILGTIIWHPNVVEFIKNGFHNDDMLFLDGSNVTSINIPRNYADLLNSFYSASLQEVSFCLYGNVSNGTIHVTHINESVMISRDIISVTSYNCKGKGVLGQLHTHPQIYDEKDRKQISAQDVFTFGWRSNENGDIIMGMVYGEDKYKIIYKENPDRLLNYTILN